MGQPAKIDSLQTITHSTLFDYFLADIIKGARIEEIPVRYRFLFCGGWFNTEDGSPERCLNVVNFKNIEYGEPDKPVRYHFVCKNCKLQKWLKASAARNQQKWIEGPDRAIVVHQFDIDKFPEEENSCILMVKIPADEEVVRLVEVTNGPNCFSTKKRLWGDRKAIFYLRGLVPDKILDPLILQLDGAYEKKK